MEKAIQDIQVKVSSRTGHGSDKIRTYAEIARQPPIDKTVRIRLDDETRKNTSSNEQSLLQTVQSSIPKALAVRVLRSGDVDVHMPNT